MLISLFVIITALTGVAAIQHLNPDGSKKVIDRF
ncbi:hypothetical protein Dform_00350 [Dehalogenimonas formicexedens]|uniref:Uncharacterized protein n=1 Tax=Dehalogenimonas formicexedens TaxID=1839801 RepID=A0A1P8F5K6_9CHLR|nr:hypothetical protein Dform_00350 [Dehalogenimonas formicexedens]